MLKDGAERVPDGVDPILWAFVRLGDSGVGATVTVQIDGALVSGEIISGKRYLEAIAAGFAKATVRCEDTSLSEKDAETLVDSFARSLTALAPKVGRMPYLHLKNATIRTSGDGRVHADAWRGRLDAVTAIVFGVPSDG